MEDGNIRSTYENYVRMHMLTLGGEGVITELMQHFSLLQ